MGIVVDTNVLSSLYDPSSDAGKLILFALERRVDLFAPESVKLELEQGLRRKLAYAEAEARETIALNGLRAASMLGRWMSPKVN